MGGIGTFEVERPVGGTDIHFHIRIEVSRRLRPTSMIGQASERGCLSSLSSVTLTVVPSRLSLLLAGVNIDTTSGLVGSHLMFIEGRSDPLNTGLGQRAWSASMLTHSS